MSPHNAAVFRSMVDIAEEWDVGSFAGVSTRDLARHGFYQEPGLEFTRDDELSFQLYSALSVYCSKIEEDVMELPSQHPLRAAFEGAAASDVVRYPADPFPFSGSNSDHRRVLDPLVGDLRALALSNPVGAMERLGQPSIRHEWTVKPGKRIYTKLIEGISSLMVSGTSQTLHEAICGPTGLRQTMEEHGDAIDVAKDLGLLVLAVLGIDQLLLPIAATVTVIVFRRGFNVYCNCARRCGFITDAQ